MKTKILLIMLTIISINARGLKNKNKREQIYGMSDYDMICLQETHWDERCMRDVENEWRGEVYANNGDGNARGVAILIKRGVIKKVKRCDDEGDGRMIGVKFEYMNEEFKLVNVYAPNEEKDRKVLFEKMGTMCDDNCMIVGDFNVWCGKLDVSENMQFRNDTTREVLEKIKIMKGLSDVWRERNPEGREFSRTQLVKGELKQSRIDFVLSTKDLARRINSIEYITTTYSDHKVLKYTIGGETKRRGGGVWCMNGQLLKDEKYKKEVKDYIKWEMDERMYEEDTGRWWERLKEGIRGMSKKHSKNMGKKEREREKRLKEELEGEEKKAGEGGNYDIEGYIRKKDELKEIEQRKCEGAIIRSRARYAIEGEKCTGYFLGLEKTRQEKNYFEQVEGKDGEKITDFVGIVERVEEFYRELYKKEGVDEESSRQVIDKLEARLSDEDREVCEGEISKGEIENAINGLGRNKSPGIDGIIGEFYIEFREELVPVLERLYRWIEEKGEMPHSMITGLVSIIYKKGSRDKLENYRPLTVLNGDYKVLAKVLANRLKEVIGTVVGSTQAYSIPGRDIADTISSIRDTIIHMKRNSGGVIASLDLNKAFDRVDHRYLYKVLGKMGFGEKMIGWIRRMYERAGSKIKVNGIVTGEFRIERSVRQGCPLSALLYSLSAEPLAVLILENRRIRGIEIPGGQVSTLYQYADDTTVTVRDRESVVEVLGSVDLYGRASGAKINIEKSEIMYIGESREKMGGIGLKENKGYMKVLGINLGIEGEEGRDRQYEVMINSLKKTLGFWKLRKLKLKGKVVVVNALIVSKIIYVMNVMDVPVRVLKEVEGIISNFLWDGGGVRIARGVLENDYEDGGLKLVNLEGKKKALRVKMMVRYLRDDGDHVWKAFLKDAMNKCGGCGESGMYMKFKKGMMNGVTEIHKEMFGAWGDFLKSVKYDCEDVRQVWEQPVFLNPKITVGGEMIYNRMMWRAGIRRIRDLVYEYVPGFMGAQAVVDEVRENGDEIWLGTAKGELEKIKKAMPKEWIGMIERENMVKGGNKIEMYVGEGECKVSLANVKTRVVYECMRDKEMRRPAAEKVWSKVMKEMDVRKIWKNVRVKWNSIECEHFDFMLRHNRIYNNLIISKFDCRVGKGCDVCDEGVETCMHEFVECGELKGYFEKIKKLINKCWEGDLTVGMEWKELWLFGANERKDGCNVNLMNFVLSHARYAVKLRRDMAHYEKRRCDVWTIFKHLMERDVGRIWNFIGEEEFRKGFVEGSSFIEIRNGEVNEVRMNFG